jgi:hypothetical protein
VSSSTIAPVVAGLAIGIVFVFMFSLLMPTADTEDADEGLDVYQLEYEGKVYQVKYNITGSRVQDMGASPGTLTLTVIIEKATEDGRLTLQFEAADALKLLNDYDELAAFVDGEYGEIEIVESASDTLIFQVDFVEETEEIEIVGSGYR